MKHPLTLYFIHNTRFQAKKSIVVTTYFFLIRPSFFIQKQGWLIKTYNLDTGHKRQNTGDSDID